MDYTVIIGLEVHVQLLTESKIFCGCANKFNPDHPNTQTCPVCLGLPGALPVMNQEAFRLSVKTGMALNCDIPAFTKWDRKQYYYPDLPKNYQISQYDLPFSQDGWVEIAVDPEQDEPRKIRLIRAHLEEDAGKNMHDESGGGADSLVDLNRTGTPLLEIVSEPDLRSAAEAKAFLQELKLLLGYLEVSDCNMQEGSLRCDANVNLHVHQDGKNIPTPIVEVKNLNSFRGVEMAIDYEIKRQVKEWESTGKTMGEVAKETRGWDAERGMTFSQRGKEEASDYRYLPDPDLVPVIVSEDFLEEIRNDTCEFPADRRTRIREAYSLSQYDAAVIVDQGRAFADYFEDVARHCDDGKQAANWVTQDVQRELNERNIGIQDFPLHSSVLGDVLSRIVKKEITTKSGRDLFAELLNIKSDEIITAEQIHQIIVDKGLAVVSDTGQLEGVIAAVIAKNAKAAEDLRSGKQAAAGPLIGQVMREVKGADPGIVRQMILDAVQE